MAEFLIQEETLDAIGDKIRQNLGYRVFTQQALDWFKNKELNNVQPLYYLTIDESKARSGIDEEERIGGYGYKVNDQKQLVPVLYIEYIPENTIDTEDILFYEGTEEIEGVFYDKWAQRSPDNSNNGEMITQHYWYTDLLTESSEDKIPPQNMPNKIDQLAQKSLNGILGSTIVCYYDHKESGHVTIKYIDYFSEQERERVFDIPDSGDKIFAIYNVFPKSEFSYETDMFSVQSSHHFGCVPKVGGGGYVLTDDIASVHIYYAS